MTLEDSIHSQRLRVLRAGDHAGTPHPSRDRLNRAVVLEEFRIDGNLLNPSAN